MTMDVRIQYQKLIIHPNYDLYIPNSFTPDGEKLMIRSFAKVMVNDFFMTFITDGGR